MKIGCISRIPPPLLSRIGIHRPLFHPLTPSLGTISTSLVHHHHDSPPWSSWSIQHTYSDEGYMTFPSIHCSCVEMLDYAHLHRTKPLIGQNILFWTEKRQPSPSELSLVLGPTGSFGQKLYSSQFCFLFERWSCLMELSIAWMLRRLLQRERDTLRALWQNLSACNFGESTEVILIKL